MPGAMVHACILVLGRWAGSRVQGQPGLLKIRPRDTTEAGHSCCDSLSMCLRQKNKKEQSNSAKGKR